MAVSKTNKKLVPGTPQVEVIDCEKEAKSFESASCDLVSIPTDQQT